MGGLHLIPMPLVVDIYIYIYNLTALQVEGSELISSLYMCKVNGLLIYQVNRNGCCFGTTKRALEAYIFYLLANWCTIKLMIVVKLVL
jgi:hypothetical protein